ncbi:inovirus Gp2 family protein [Jeongeupia sp. USM3]|uniref:inovirus Gp2 family protein n=1 Tax=Jeongeupia sp. USM3 TaxID=1906741 RepID=UPI00089DEF4B|nr:inovirus Gp2 family protein [Jeongeupia sp. USM3]AOX99255.1 transposase [Jeongeupia sp. USM3]
MFRHSANTNQTLHDDSHYAGLPIQRSKGPFVLEYLNRLQVTVERALAEHPRVFAFRIDLRFPSGRLEPSWVEGNGVIGRFVASFRAKVEHNRKRARELRRYSHDSSVRYVWAREVGERSRPHYHVAFMLNGNAFCTLGKYEMGRDNLFNRLQEAWASALDLSVEGVEGLVEVPKNACYRLRRDDGASVEDFFYRASYLCKVATKRFGDGTHGFGASRC